MRDFGKVLLARVGNRQGKTRVKRFDMLMFRKYCYIWSSSRVAASIVMKRMFPVRKKSFYVTRKYGHKKLRSKSSHHSKDPTVMCFSSGKIGLIKFPALWFLVVFVFAAGNLRMFHFPFFPSQYS